MRRQCFIVIGFISLVIYAGAVNAESANYIKRPAFMSEYIANSYMFEEFKLFEPMQVVLPNGELANDFLLEHEPSDKIENGYWNIKGATKESEEDAKIAFLNYEAPIYIKPNGKLLTLYKYKDTPVRVIKDYKGWRLISDKRNNYGWVENNQLKYIDGDKLLVLPDYSDDKLKNWVKIKEEIDATKGLISAKKCPDNLTEAEKDYVGEYTAGYDDYKYVNEAVLKSYRLQAYRACNNNQEPSMTLLSSDAFPNMKSDKCNCFYDEMFVGVEKEEVLKRLWNKLSDLKCYKLKYHYRCEHLANDEGDLTYAYSCPMSCFTK